MSAGDSLLVFEDELEPRLASWQVTCFAINVIMGSGFLGMPAGFLASGLLLGPAVLLVVTWLQWFAACQLTQVISRAHALIISRDASATLTPTLARFALDETLLANQETGGGTAEGAATAPSLILPSHTSYELGMLCRLSFGRWAERLAVGAMQLYQVGCLWSYVSVFASSFAASVPVPWLNSGETCDIYKEASMDSAACLSLYYWWAQCFALAMAVLLALDLSEQATFQCMMTAARLVIVVVMVGTLVLGGGRVDFGLADMDAGVDALAERAPLPLVRWEGLPRMVPVGVFSVIFQIGVPSLLQPLGEKRAFAPIFGTALGACFVVYTTLGLAAALVLRGDVDPSW